MKTAPHAGRRTAPSVKAHRAAAFTRTTDPQRLLPLFRYEPDTGLIRSPEGRQLGTVDFEGYVRVLLKVGPAWCRYRAHRLAFVAMTGQWPAGDVDHIDGRRAHNTWHNLRDVDRATNAQNQRCATRSNHTSGVLGVSWDRRKGRWLAQIQVHGRNCNLGRFLTVAEAQAAYLFAKRRLHAGCTI
jgi:hypothetical protein